MRKFKVIFLLNGVITGCLVVNADSTKAAKKSAQDSLSIYEHEFNDEIVIDYEREMVA